MEEREGFSASIPTTTYARHTMKRATNASRLRRSEAVALPVEPTPLEWGGWIIRPTDRKYQRSEEIPNSSGIYAWYSREGDLLYVGRSKAMNTRLWDHHMVFWGGVLLSYREVPEEYLNGVEMVHIKTLAPSQNVARQAAALPFWGAMSQAIDRAWQDVLPAMKERIAARDTALAEQIAARL